MKSPSQTQDENHNINNNTQNVNIYGTSPRAEEKLEKLEEKIDLILYLIDIVEKKIK